MPSLTAHLTRDSTTIEPPSNAFNPLAWLSILLFIASLTQNGYYTDEGGDARGFMLVLVGFLGVPFGHYSWFANPALFVSWHLMHNRNKQRIAFGFAVAALPFAGSFLLKRTIVTNEGGGEHSITGYAPGYWLWIASITTSIAACISILRSNRNVNAS